MTLGSSGRIAPWGAVLLGVTGCGLVGADDVVIGEDFPPSEGGSGAVGSSSGGSSDGAARPDGAGSGGTAGQGAESFGGGSAGSAAGAAGSSAGSGGTGAQQVSACVGEGFASVESAVVGLPGDFDRDGYLDLATANVDGSVSVFRGNGEGCLVSKLTYATELAADVYWWDFPPILAGADLDANGTTDLVAANPDAKAVSVLLGAPDGSFALANRYALDAFGLAVVDWDADDVEDLVVVTNGSDDRSAVVILHGSGDGTFGSPAPVWSGAYLGGLNVGDFNHDGRPDALLGGGTVFLQEPNGTLLERSRYGAGYASVSVIDLNRDALLDVVSIVPCVRGGPEGFSVLLGLGDGTFAASGLLEGPCSRHEVIAAGSVTRGDTIDLVRYADMVLLGAGDGTFLPEPVTMPGASYASLLALADWNHDELLDIAVLMEERVKVRLGNGDGSFVTGD
jgi:hypothetical protein